MGMGIAQVTAQVAKIPVMVYDANSAALDKSLAFMYSLLDKNVAKGKMTEAERDQTRSLVRPVSSLKELSSVSFAIEAIVENFAVKQTVLKELDAVTKPGTILATNTSSISITKLGSCTARPDKVCLLCDDDILEQVDVVGRTCVCSVLSFVW